MSDDMDPMTNDEWLKSHVMPKLDKLEKRPDGQYIINVGLCWDRHRYKDLYEGRVRFSVFPKAVILPQDWEAHWSHVVNFYSYLQKKLESFDQPNARVDLRVYCSGASGCKKALVDAFNDNVKRKGFSLFSTPSNWKLIPMEYNRDKGYEEKPDIYSYPAE